MLDAGSVRKKPRLDLAGVLPEDLEVDDGAQSELCGRENGCTAEARVPDRRHARCEAVRRTRPRDRDHRVEVETSLALDVEPEPVEERKAVAEARIERVLEMGVRVDEPGKDGGAPEVLEVLAVELVGPPDSDDPPVLDRDTTVLDRRSLDRQHPVGAIDVQPRASVS